MVDRRPLSSHGAAPRAHGEMQLIYLLLRTGDLARRLAIDSEDDDRPRSRRLRLRDALRHDCLRLSTFFSSTQRTVGFFRRARSQSDTQGEAEAVGHGGAAG